MGICVISRVSRGVEEKFFSQNQQRLQARMWVCESEGHASGLIGVSRYRLLRENAKSSAMNVQEGVPAWTGHRTTETLFTPS